MVNACRGGAFAVAALSALAWPARAAFNCAGLTSQSACEAQRADCYWAFQRQFESKPVGCENIPYPEQAGVCVCTRSPDCNVPSTARYYLQIVTSDPVKPEENTASGCEPAAYCVNVGGTASCKVPQVDKDANCQESGFMTGKCAPSAYCNNSANVGANPTFNNALKGSYDCTRIAGAVQPQAPTRAPTTQSPNVVTPTQPPNPFTGPSSSPLNQGILIAAVGGGLAIIAIGVGTWCCCFKHPGKLPVTIHEDDKARLAAVNVNVDDLLNGRPLKPNAFAGTISVKAPRMTVDLVVEYDFVAENPNELGCVAGERITGTVLVDGEWWEARNAQGRVGLVPCAFVRSNAPALPGRVTQRGPVASKRATRQQQPEVALIVKYNFKAEGPEELSAQQGESLIGVGQVDAEWWEARTPRNKVGLIPASYVEVVGAIKQGSFLAQEEQPDF